MPSMVSATVPELVNVVVSGLAGLVRFSDVGLRDACPPFASKPTPVRRIHITEFEEELLTTRYALRGPVARGMKLRLMLQVAPGNTGVEQPWPEVEFAMRKS